MVRHLLQVIPLFCKHGGDQMWGPCMQAVASQLASLEAADDSFAGFMDAETATFASRIRRLMRSKVEELQSSMPGTDPGTHL